MAADDSGPPPRPKRFRLGPGLLVTAAFIGPGTVVTASKAGAERGCGLLWTVIFASIGAIVLQSLAARLGILRGQGLGESIREVWIDSPFLKIAVSLIVIAIGIGNAAYQTGNLTGAAIGIKSGVGGSAPAWVCLLMLGSSLVVLVGRYRILHRVLVALVVLLSLSFVTAATCAMPSFDRILRGAMVPRFHTDDLTLVLAMIGTTIVPYNLFLHASAAASTWSDDGVAESIRQSNWDTTLSVALGGIVTASISVTACTAFFDQQVPWTSTDNIAQQLQPTLGNFSSIAFAVGLFAAGLTSSITAPIATAYAMCGCFNWPADPSSLRFRCVAISVVGIGGATALSLNRSPSSIIVLAQLTNGLLLPIIAAFMLIVVSRRTENPQLSFVQLWSARLIVGFVGLLGLWRIYSIFR